MEADFAGYGSTSAGSDFASSSASSDVAAVAPASVVVATITTREAGATAERTEEAEEEK